MELFDISYRRRCDEQERFYEEFEGISENENQLEVVEDLKKMIYQDLKRIYNFKLDRYHHNDTLKAKIEKLLKTYCDETYGGDNFLTLTEQYICFNHYDELAEYNPKNLESLVPFRIPKASTIQTIVIITRDFNQFYFIKEKENVLTNKTSSIVETFSLEDDDIKTTMISYDGKLVFKRTDDDIARFIQIQKVNKYKVG